MASQNSNYPQIHAFADLAHFEKKSPDQILGQNSGTNASQPTETTISSRVAAKNQNVKLKKQLDLQEEGGQPKPLRFSISLTPEEIEKDLIAMTGKRPLRSKKKRTKKVQNDLDVLFPGSSLDGHTPETLRKTYGPFSSKRF